jgi:hypothetical protein
MEDLMQQVHAHLVESMNGKFYIARLGERVGIAVYSDFCDMIQIAYDAGVHEDDHYDMRFYSDGLPEGIKKVVEFRVASFDAYLEVYKSYIEIYKD